MGETQIASMAMVRCLGNTGTGEIVSVVIKAMSQALRTGELVASGISPVCLQVSVVIDLHRVAGQSDDDMRLLLHC